MKGNVFDAAICDMHGVVTRTTDLHAAAWKELFDSYLRTRQNRGEPAPPPFDLNGDYLAYVDGKPHTKGARSFLASRGITSHTAMPQIPPIGRRFVGLAVALQTLIGQARCAVLLVKPRPREVFRLKVGDTLM